MRYYFNGAKPTESVYAKALDHELLSEVEEQQLLREAQAGDDNAREKLILCNLRLVRSVVLKYENSEFNVSADDLMGDGIIGLCKAITKYDESIGTRLSTYAVLWIHQATARSRLLEGTIRLPEQVKREVIAINKAKATLLSEGRALCVDAISQMTQIDSEQVERLKHLESDVIQVMSLDMPIADGEDAQMMDFIPDEKAEAVYQEVEMEADLEFFLSKLEPRDRFVMERSYGIPIKMTNGEIAAAISCNHNYIPQILEAAMTKLKRLAKALRGTPEQIKLAIENPVLVMTGQKETIPLFDPNQIHNKIDTSKKPIPRKKKQKSEKQENTPQQLDLFE